MPVTTLQQLIEEVDAKEAVTRVVIGGAQLPKVTSISYNFSIGQAPAAQITIPGIAWLPPGVQEEAAVQIWFGYRSGFTYQERLVFGGAVVDSIGNNGADITVTCVMDGPRKLNYSYNRRISYNFDNVTAEESVTALLILAGVANYAVNLDPWLIGTVVPQTIQFSTYGEAINKVSEVDGSPWYALPTGQVRVENRDPVPSTTFRRVYFTGVLTGPFESQPTGISNTAARPRINDITRDTKRDEVGNFIEVDGAVVTTTGPNGEQNSDQIIETVDGASGQFPNGAYWIPTPPLFQDFTFSNELIDTDAKAFEVAERYFNLKNRLFEKLDITVPGDPDVFLGATVKIIDPSYSGVSSLYFVEGYSTNIDAGSCTTTLNLTGGPESGTTGFAAPFAEFYWVYQALHSITPGTTFPINMGPGANPGAKLCEDVPVNSNQDPEHSNDPGVDVRMVIIGLDGSASQDFDGYIVSWDWSWVDQLDVTHTFAGVRSYLMINPDLQTSVEVTLTVTDNSGRTDSITKRIYTDADHIDVPPAGDPQQNDTPQGGGTTAGPCVINEFPPNGAYPPDSPGPGGCAGMGLAYYVAAEAYAMGSVDNRTWHDLAKADVPVSGDFVAVGSGVNNFTGKAYALFGTDQGEIVLTSDVCETGELVYTIPGGSAINCIWFDSEDAGIPAQGNDFGGEGGPDASITIPVYTESSPGILTMVQAYQQCLKVGFPPAGAVIMVAIMVRESGLYSHATNTVGNTPPSTDRGIAQWNNYYWPQISDACAYNTECAIQRAFQYSGGGTDFSPWNTSGPGTYLVGTNLTAVQEAVGYVGNVTPPGGATNTNVPLTFRIWVGTQDGRIFTSDDSGQTWTLWVEFADGLPVRWIATPPGGSLWAFGGDTSVPSSLVLIDPHKTKEFVSLTILGDLLDAIHASGGSNTILTAAANNSSLLLGFSGGVSPPVWTNPDPIGTPDGWVPAVGLPGSVVASAPGFAGEYLVA